MSGRTIYLTDGITMATARWSVKMVLEEYGKVDACHMGDRFNPRERPPWVKFNTKEGAQRALDAMKKGIVIANSKILRGEWSKGGEPPTPVEDILDRPDLNLTSRDLFAGSSTRKALEREAHRDRDTRRRSRSARGRDRRSRDGRSRGRDRRSRDRRSRDRRDRGKKRKCSSSSSSTTSVAKPKIRVRKFTGISEQYCPLGHRVAVVAGAAEGGCDVCGRRPEPTSRCKTCGYDICKLCIMNRVLA